MDPPVKSPRASLSPHPIKSPFPITINGSPLEEHLLNFDRNFSASLREIDQELDFVARSLDAAENGNLGPGVEATENAEVLLDHARAVLENAKRVRMEALQVRQDVSENNSARNSVAASTPRTSLHQVAVAWRDLRPSLLLEATKLLDEEVDFEILFAS